MKRLPSLQLRLLIAVLLLSGCVRKQEHKPDIVVAHLRADPVSLHPTNSNDYSQFYIFQYTQKTLTRIDLRTLQQIPVTVKALAQISPDKLRYTYELRDDVKWDDGSPLTVDDVIFTVKANKSPFSDNAGRRSTFDNIKDIEKDPANPHRFTMVAKSIYYANAQMFDEMYLMEKHFWDPEGRMDKIAIPSLDDTGFVSKHPGLTQWAAGFNAGNRGHDPKQLQGLGAYQLTEWTPGNSITLTRKQHWWGEKDTSVYSSHYPEKIIFRIINADASTALALRNQTLDAVNFINTAEFVKLKADTGFTRRYFMGLAANYTYSVIIFNQHKPVFEDVRVRRAMAYLSPVDEIIKLLTKGTGTRMVSFVHPDQTTYFNDTLKPVPFDLEKAKKLLTDAGWIDTDGDNIRDKVMGGKRIRLHFSVLYVTDPLVKEALLMMRDAMQKAGVDMTAEPTDASVAQQRASDHDFDALMISWSGSAIPDDPEQFFHTRNWANHGANFGGFGNAHSDSLIDMSNHALKPEERAMWLKKLEAVVYEQQPYIFLFSTKRKFIISKRFDNIAIYNERPGLILSNLRLKEE